MKTILISAFLIASTVAQALPVPASWVSEPDKTILIAFNPKLKVTLTKLGVDDVTYGQLDVELNYSFKDSNAQASEIMKSYPGYQMQKVILQVAGDYTYEIPILSIRAQVNPSPGVDGPYVNRTHYVTRAQFAALATAIQSVQPVVQISGQISGTLPMSTVVEHKEVDSQICSQVLKNGGTLGSVLDVLSSVSPSELGVGSFQYESTRASLVNDIRASCFELDQPVKLSSFTQLLGLKLKSKTVSRPLVGETKQKTYKKTAVPLAYSLTQEVSP